MFCGSDVATFLALLVSALLCKYDISRSKLNLLSALSPRLCKLYFRTASCAHMVHSEVLAMALDLGRVNDALTTHDASSPFWNRSFERTEPPPPYSSGETTRYSSSEPVGRDSIQGMPAWLRHFCLENAEPQY